MNTSIWDPEQQPEQHYGSPMEKAKVGDIWFISFGLLTLEVVRQHRP